MFNCLILFARKHLELLRLAQLVSGSLMVIRPGDVLILKTATPLTSNDRKRIHDYWRALGGDIPVAIVDGHWQVLVAHPLAPASDPSSKA